MGIQTMPTIMAKIVKNTEKCFAHLTRENVSPFPLHYYLTLRYNGFSLGLWLYFRVFFRILQNIFALPHHPPPPEVVPEDQNQIFII